jgi:hypothetical protein
MCSETDSFGFIFRAVQTSFFLFSEDPQVHQQAFYGESAGAILMSDLQCNGHETSIYDCRRKEHSEHDCTHARDVGVVCTDGASMRNCFKSSSIPLVHSLNLLPLPSHSPSNVNVQIVISILCKSQNNGIANGKYIRTL